MTVYRVSDYSRFVQGAAPACNSVRYFLSRERALKEAGKLATVHEVLDECQMNRDDVNKFGVVTVWVNRWPDPDYEVRVEEGEIEDAPAPRQASSTTSPRRRSRRRTARVATTKRRR